MREKKLCGKCNIELAHSSWSRLLRSKKHAKSVPEQTISDELIDWLCEEVLTSIRKTGQYKVETEIVERKQIY